MTSNNHSFLLRGTHRPREKKNVNCYISNYRVLALVSSNKLRIITNLKVDFFAINNIDNFNLVVVRRSATIQSLAPILELLQGPDTVHDRATLALLDELCDFYQVYIRWLHDGKKIPHTRYRQPD